ncbi:isoleucine--tRNA ligase [archaeon]|nr:isoleucine--tRNA ligase [archaeon]
MTNINEIEQQIIDYWKKEKIFKKSLERTKNGKPYIFYDGPPFATGLPHYGHLLASILKDVFPRFFTMNGMYVKRNWGWDCHGLPVENIAEKELGINSKDEIEEMGVQKFNNFCRSKVMTYADEWEKYVDRIGRWVDFAGGYKTMDTNYIESVWWAFKQLYEKGYLYEGEKILMYCPRCSTPLAKSEIAMDNSYKNVKDITITVKFKLDGYENTYAIAWTTTPWTLPSNLALAVGPELEYTFVKDKSDGNTYVMAKELIQNFYKSEEDYEITKVMKGKELEGQKYEPLFPYFKDTENAFQFILGDFVTAEDGTGIVHTAPAFGEDDNIVCRKYKIPMVQPVDETGHFTSEVTDYAGKYIHDTNEEIVIDLKKSGKAIASRKMEHEYPFCYRCDTKLMYRALPAWFVDIQKIKERLLELNMNINWIPSFIKEGRMKHNITTAPDWNITRNRYWATAIPIWKSTSGKIKVLGSIEELKQYATNLPEGVEIDLHKDFLDSIKLEIDGEEYTRIPEVLDCWFESGSMTFAQFHYPFENKEFFDTNFPAQFVVEYIGQTRAWFYYMIALSAILFDKIPFENVLTTGTILAEDGQKMSKSKKNYPDPLEVVEKYGADALRFYLLQSPVMNADNFNFSEKGLQEIYKKVMVLLYNVRNFYNEYKQDSDLEFVKSDNVMDKWILSITEKLSSFVKKYLEEYNTVKACAEIKKYLEDLSTWYVRNSRDRFNEGNENARKTLRYVLEKISRVLAPIIPFAAEKVFQDMNGKEKSVHLQDWPNSDDSLIDEELEKEMNLVREIVSQGLRQRDQNNASLKWPLSKVDIESTTLLPAGFIPIIAQELNVKVVEIKESKEIKVELDLEMTPGLEAEGYMRELSRNIQATRKKLGLNKEDSIDLEIYSPELKEIIENGIEFLKERTGSREIKIMETSIKSDDLVEFKIKDKDGSFVVKLNY